MRRILGALLMLAGAYALYWAWQGAGGHWPRTWSLLQPFHQRHGRCATVGPFPPI